MIGELNRSAAPPALVTITHTNRDGQFRVTAITGTVPVDLHLGATAHVDELRVVREAVEPPAFFLVLKAFNEGSAPQHVEQELLSARREDSHEAGFDDVVGEVCGGGRGHGDEEAECFVFEGMVVFACLDES